MDDNTSRNVELYVRSLAPCGTRNEQDTIIERLLDLEEEGAVDEVDLTVWGNAVCLDGTSADVGTGKRVAERIQDFHSWSERGEASLEPFFNFSIVDSSIYGDTFRRVIPPHRCLAVYEDDQLQEVYPSTVNGTARTLQEGLQALEGDETAAQSSEVVFEEV